MHLACNHKVTNHGGNEDADEVGGTPSVEKQRGNQQHDIFGPFRNQIIDQQHHWQKIEDEFNTAEYHTQIKAQKYTFLRPTDHNFPILRRSQPEDRFANLIGLKGMIHSSFGRNMQHKPRL